MPRKELIEVAPIEGMQPRLGTSRFNRSSARVSNISRLPNEMIATDSLRVQTWLLQM